MTSQFWRAIIPWHSSICSVSITSMPWLTSNRILNTKVMSIAWISGPLGLNCSVDFRKIIVQSILCTDMSCHQEYVESFKEQLKRIESHTMDLTDDASRDKERMILCSIIMKCADISNCVSIYYGVCCFWNIVLNVFLVGKAFWERKKLGRDTSWRVLYPRRPWARIRNPLCGYQWARKSIIGWFPTFVYEKCSAWTLHNSGWNTPSIEILCWKY